MIMTIDIAMRSGTEIRCSAARRPWESRTTTPSSFRIAVSRLPRVDQHMPQRLHLLERPSGAERDATERIVGDRNRQTGRMPDDMIEIGEERAAAGQHDPLVDDVGGELWRGVLQRHLDGLDDRADGLGEAFRD